MGDPLILLWGGMWDLAPSDFFSVTRFFQAPGLGRCMLSKQDGGN